MFASYSNLCFVIDEMSKTEAGGDTVDLNFKQLKKRLLPNLRLSHLKQELKIRVISDWHMIWFIN